MLSYAFHSTRAIVAMSEVDCIELCDAFKRTAIAICFYYCDSMVLLFAEYVVAKHTVIVS